MTITKQMRKDSGVGDGELEGVTAIPREIEGVVLGITIRERDNTDLCKVSVRTHPPISASELIIILYMRELSCAPLMSPRLA